jgi:hypothetical protein
MQKKGKKTKKPHYGHLKFTSGKARTETKVGKIKELREGSNYLP